MKTINLQTEQGISILEVFKTIEDRTDEDCLRAIEFWDKAEAARVCNIDTYKIQVIATDYLDTKAIVNKMRILNNDGVEDTVKEMFILLIEHHVRKACKMIDNLTI